MHPYILIEIHRMNYHVHGPNVRLSGGRFHLACTHITLRCAAHTARLTNGISYTDRIQKGTPNQFRIHLLNLVAVYCFPFESPWNLDVVVVVVLFDDERTRF